MHKIQSAVEWIAEDGIIECLQRYRWAIFLVVIVFVDYAGVVFTKPHLTAAVVTVLTIGGALALGWAEEKFRWIRHDQW